MSTEYEHLQRTEYKAGSFSMVTFRCLKCPNTEMRFEGNFTASQIEKEWRLFCKRHEHGGEK